MAAAGDGLEKLEDMIVRAAESTGAQVAAAKAAIGKVIFGQERVVEQALITVLSGGHALLVGLPGLAKTKLVETMGTVLGLEARRIQFTPDLMPSDILGSEVLEESAGGKRSFRFLPGPIFAQLLMADEINRASPRRRQSAAWLARGRKGGRRKGAAAGASVEPALLRRHRHAHRRRRNVVLHELADRPKAAGASLLQHPEA